VATHSIGLYGGAFDPPHRAHTALAEAFAAQCRLTALHVVPTGSAYHRTRPLTAASHRLAMARLAFAPPAVIDDIEIQRSGPSYTIDTVAALRARHGPAAAIKLLVGEDQWHQIHSWHRYQELLEIATIVVAVRVQKTPTWWQKHVKNDALTPPEVLQWTPQPISATEIRAALAAGQSIDDWVSPAVARYIDDHRLYRPD
jgi:nicotinate-nucleotide adenylyltransferase